MLLEGSGDMSEHMEQAYLVQWFRRKYPDVLIFAIPNGGERNKSSALKIKVEGGVRGVPDLFIPAWRLWVEMKTETGKLSQDQKAMIPYLESIGHKVLVGYGFQDAVRKICEFDIDR